MRNNSPVTSVEHELKDGELIVSKTDLQGRIVYVNPMFVRISGFQESELIGQPHNLVRHPDMPQEAFRDLWDTLKAGKPWTGYVKNRCKNGDYYWVQANATPYWENGSLAGYMSVRKRAERSVVEKVEKAYRLFREGRARGLAIREGCVIETGRLADVLYRVKHASIKNRMIGLAATLILMMCAIGGYGLLGLKDAGAASFQASLALVAEMIIASAVFMAFAIHHLHRSISAPTGRLREQLREIAQGNLNLTVLKERNDEIGEVTDAVRSMFIKLSDDLSASSLRADEMSRIKEALDNVSTGVTVSNEHNALVYLNHAGKRLFDKLAADRGGADALLGRKLSELMDEGELKSAFTAQLNTSITLEGVIGGHTLRIRPSPVNNAKNEYIGRVTEWVDRTEEVAVEQEVADMVTAVANGDFAHRIAMTGKTGFIQSVSAGINHFVEVTESGLNEVVKMLRALADGDLTTRMQGQYTGTFEQLKADANATVDQLTSTINSIRSASTSINTAATQIAAGNSDLSSRTEAQAASIEETAASMEELTSTVKHNADNARLASELAHNATDVAAQGGAVVRQVVDTMGTIADSSRKIADIVSLIDSIAFQTNILALNAAVEAARAGEQGRGFAVVAGEVRNLAQRSSVAAKEIKGLIEDSASKVEGGHKLVTEAGQTMEKVVGSIRKVSDIMTEISSASAEQSQGIEQVNIALSQMDEATQQNAALVEEAAAAARSMEEQASSLVNAVDIFQVGGLIERHGDVRNTKVAHFKAQKPEAPARRTTLKAAAAAADRDGDWAVF